jgi:hypothetical protein
MIRELFVWGKYVTYNYFREKTKIYNRNPRQVAGAPSPSLAPFSLPPLYIYVTQWSRQASLQSYFTYRPYRQLLLLKTACMEEPGEQCTGGSGWGGGRGGGAHKLTSRIRNN